MLPPIPLSALYGPAVALPPLVAPGLSESSGLAASRSQPGLYYTVGDSGGPAALYAFRLDGSPVRVLPVRGAENRDWEALAAGACPGGQGDCIYVGDIGDNHRERPAVRVYAVPEPGPDETEARVLASWELSYPDEPHNAEALLYDPRDGRLYLVTKDKGSRAGLYRLPAEPGTGRLEKVGELETPGHQALDRKVTGGELRADGRELALRTYTHVLVWELAPEGGWPEGPPDVVRGPPEPQGEALAYTPEGDLLTTSEGEPTPVHRLPRAGR